MKELHSFLHTPLITKPIINYIYHNLGRGYPHLLFCSINSPLERYPQIEHQKGIYQHKRR